MNTVIHQTIDMQSAHAAVHPMIASILNAVVESPEIIARAQYVARLTKMDWAFEWAEGDRWRKGRDELKALRVLRETLDADATIWNRHCGKDYVVFPVAVKS